MNKPVDSAVSAAPSADALAMIDRLIAFPTVSRDSNLGLIEYARDELKRLGVRSQLVYDAGGKKANLFATLSAEPDRVKTGGLVLSGHTDTVPVDGQDWSSEPFKATHRDGRIHGRGTADMKGFIAIALAWAPRFLAAQERLPVHLSLTYDEETTFLGVNGLVADLAERGIRPAGCIIGEPTDMQAIVAHKGKRDLCCKVRGREAHSALTPQGVNAIEFAARLIAYIRGVADRLARDEPRDDRFAVPHSTLQTGLIKGGIATNVVPRDCEFHFEMRNLPSMSHDTHGIRDRRVRGARTRAADAPCRRRRGHRVRARPRPAGLRHRARRGPGPLGAGRRPHDAHRHRRGELRHRGERLHEGRHPDRRAGTRQHRAGAQA